MRDQTHATAAEDAPPSCIGCGARAPRADSSFALIRDAGWRLTRPIGGDGSPRPEWRCAACWGALKKIGTRATPLPRKH